MRIVSSFQELRKTGGYFVSTGQGEKLYTLWSYAPHRIHAVAHPSLYHGDYLRNLGKNWEEVMSKIAALVQADEYIYIPNYESNLEQNQKPRTQEPIGAHCAVLSEQSPLLHGKYAGKSIQEIFTTDPQYLAWLDSTSNGNNDFSAFLHHFVRVKQATYYEAVQQQAQTVKEKSQWVGTIGERKEIAATITGTRSGEGQYGYWYLTLLRDAEGNAYKYFNAIRYKNSGFATKGEIVSFKATIKEHAEYAGEKQTVLSRAGKATNLSPQAQERLLL